MPFLCWRMGGAFIDDMFFNGSWDFICFFDTIILDLKDIYILLNFILLFVFGALYIPEYLKLSKEQRKRLDFISWVKK